MRTNITVRATNSVVRKNSRRRGALLALLLSTALTAIAQSTSGDGIPDSWKTNGVDITVGQKKSHLDLAALGASVRHKDIFVWVEWMEVGDHSHKPSPEAIQIVQRAFETAPVTNPDGLRGIRLHTILASKSIPEDGGLLGSVDNQGNYDWADFDKIKKQVMPKEIQGVFYFCLFAHDFDSEHHSGITKTLPGRDFIVSLGGFTNGVGNTQEQAGTFMHELGHALGLHHGGKDDINYKPNYLSVMNYAFQMDGLAINVESGNYDYSDFGLDADEHQLSEASGLTTDPYLAKFGTQYFCQGASTTIAVESIAGPVDWNCNGQSEQTVSADINGDRSLSKLKGWDDWQNIVLGGPTGALGVAPQYRLKPADELSPSEADKISVMPVGGVSAAVVGRSVSVSWRPIPLERVFAYRLYRGTAQNAQEVALSPENNAVDEHPNAGNNSYYVVALLAPHSRSQIELQKLADQIQQTAYLSVIEAGPAAENVSATMDVVHDKATIQKIGDAVPVNAQLYSSTGLKRPPQKSFLPPALVATAPSRAVTVEIK